MAEPDLLLNPERAPGRIFCKMARARPACCAGAPSEPELRPSFSCSVFMSDNPGLALNFTGSFTQTRMSGTASSNESPPANFRWAVNRQ